MLVRAQAVKYKGAMPTFDQKWLLDTILLIPPLLLSLTVHELAHARTALAFGDPTAKYMGRVTMNPLAHLDPIGTLVLVFTRFVGWARPVPVNPVNLEPRRLGSIMVSLAGPLSNLGIAVVCGLGLRLWYHYSHRHPLAGDQWGAARTVGVLLYYTMMANLGLCAFNLIPLFPLDGHHVARELLPAQQQAHFMRWQLRCGMYILLALIFLPRLLAMLTRDHFDYDPIRFVLLKFRTFVLGILGI